MSARRARYSASVSQGLLAAKAHSCGSKQSRARLIGARASRNSNAPSNQASLPYAVPHLRASAVNSINALCPPARATRPARRCRIAPVKNITMMGTLPRAPSESHQRGPKLVEEDYNTADRHPIARHSVRPSNTLRERFITYYLVTYRSYVAISTSHFRLRWIRNR